MAEDLDSLRAEIQEIRSALGALCVLSEGSVHKLRPKLEGVDPNTPEAFYMLAAFCFDLSRKLDYIFLAMRRFAEETHPAFARRVLSDNGEAYGDPDWEATARRTEEVFLRVLREIHEEHERLLARLAR
jgi:hypothetical protein